jgi:hypothetical protein
MPTLRGLSYFIPRRSSALVHATRLDLRSAAVHEQFDTGDETGVFRSQKQWHLSNFLPLTVTIAARSARNNCQPNDCYHRGSGGAREARRDWK